MCRASKDESCAAAGTVLRLQINNRAPKTIINSLFIRECLKVILSNKLPHPIDLCVSEDRCERTSAKGCKLHWL